MAYPQTEIFALLIRPEHRRKGARGMASRIPNDRSLITMIFITYSTVDIELRCKVVDSLFLLAWIEDFLEGSLLHNTFGLCDFEVKHDEDLEDSATIRRKPRAVEHSSRKQ